ncbi:MAG: FHA domain-containing protein [bacterium]|nr:FHA domain-containing protein [bacterium]
MNVSPFFTRRLPFALAVLCSLLTGIGAFSSQVTAQIEPPLADLSQRLGQATLITYACNFDAQTNALRIIAGLAGADARPIPADGFTISAQVGGGIGVLGQERIRITPITRRAPMRIVVVFDVTDTMPLAEMVRAFSLSFADELDPNDEVALITFSADIAPTTQFYIDKNRLVTEHLLAATPRPGDNRVYDALLEGVNAFTNGGDQRQAVVLITDSGRRNTDQTASADIVARARQLGVQIYPVAFFYEDAPDPEELIALADQTGGYAWVYNADRSRVAVGAAVGDYLNQLVRLLNSEVEITVDLAGVTIPVDAAQGLPVDLVIDPANERTLSASITCPVRPLDHAIRFLNIDDGTTLTVPLNVNVETTSETDLSDSRVVYFLNDVVVRSTTERFYRLDVPALAPGAYELRAELRGRNEQVLASTPTLTIYVQQGLRLNTLDGAQTNLAGEVQFQAIVNLNMNLRDVQFRISRRDTPETAEPFGAGVAPVQDDGRAVLTVPDIQAEVARLFPGDPAGSAYVVSAIVPGESPDVPLLAVSDPLAITVSDQPFVPGAAANQAGNASASVNRPSALGSLVSPESWVYQPFTLPIALIVMLVILNILMFRQVGRARIRRMIAVQDRHELSDRLMAITVRRAGIVKTHPLTKKTVYIGRGSQNDLNVGDDVAISRQHGVVMWRRNDWYFANRSGRVVSRVNGRRRRGYVLHRLEPITEIQIGNTHLYFHSNAQQDISEMTKTNL